MFDRKGLILIPTSATTEDDLMELALENGADDVTTEGDTFEITCEVDAFEDLRTAITEAGLEPDSSQITRIPSNTVDVESVSDAKKILTLMELLDDQDDIQSVSANFNISEEIMAKIEADS